MIHSFALHCTSLITHHHSPPFLKLGVLSETIKLIKSCNVVLRTWFVPWSALYKKPWDLVCAIRRVISRNWRQHCDLVDWLVKGDAILIIRVVAFLFDSTTDNEALCFGNICWWRHLVWSDAVIYCIILLHLFQLVYTCPGKVTKGRF